MPIILKLTVAAVAAIPLVFVAALRSAEPPRPVSEPDQYSTPKRDRLPLFNDRFMAPAPAQPAPSPPIASQDQDHQQTQRQTQPTPKPERNVCTRHGMIKRITHGGRSWRCARRRH